MNTNVYKGIEIGACCLLSGGVNFVVEKTAKSVINPKTIPEKIITELGILGIDIAADYVICTAIHNMMYPSEVSKYEQLETENLKAIEISGEFNEVIAGQTIKIDNKVDDILKEMKQLEDKINGRSTNG